MFFQDGLTGSAWGDWSLYTASPVRAGRESKVARNFFGGESTSYASFDPAKELGVQDPIGFWDPLGLSADKDEATFKRRRAVEIKHGRIVRVQVVLNQWIRRHSHTTKASCLISTKRNLVSCGQSHSRWEQHIKSTCINLQFSCQTHWGHVCHNWLHRTWVLQVPRIPFSISWIEVCRCAKRPCCFV